MGSGMPLEWSVSFIHEPCPGGHYQLVTSRDAAFRPDSRAGIHPMPKRTTSAPQGLKFTKPPLRGFLIHLVIFMVVLGGLAALNLARNPTHPWFLWVLLAWGIVLAIHDIVLLVQTRPKRGDISSAKQASPLPKHHRVQT